MTVEIANTFYKINNYHPGKYSMLERNLSVWDEPTHSYSWNNYFYNEETKELLIPGGINKYKLQNLLKKEEFITDTIKEDSYRTATYKCTTEPRDEEQENAINFLLQDEKQLMLCLNTGGGKTYCTINALSQMKKRSMVIVDKEKIMLQWKESFLKFTNLKEDDIYLISGRDSIEKLMKNKKDCNIKVFIASHRTLSSYAEDDWSRITSFFNKIKIGVKVYDEAHVEAKNIFKIDCYTNTFKSIYLTATPARSNPLEDKVFQYSIDTIPQYGLEKKFDDKYTIAYYVSYNSKPNAYQIAKCKTKRGFDINTFSDYTFDLKYDKFVEVVTKILDITLKQSGKTVIIVHKNDHIVKLKETLSQIYPEIEIGTFCGLVTDKTSREAQLDKKIILSTDKSMGKAVDIPNLQFVLMTVPTSSKVVAEQTMGRLRKLPDNRQTMYFDITDTGFGACTSQRKSRRQILDKKVKAIKTINL